MSSGPPAARKPGVVQPALLNMSAWLRPEPGLTVVTPLVRALVLISAFSPQERWLGNGQLAQRTGLPPSTVSRIAQSLVHLGYLLHDEAERKYRLAPAVLGLGYAAIAHSAIQGLAGERMAAFARQHKVHVCLAARDRLDLVVLECRRSLECPVALPLHVGMRVGIAQSPMGWSMLAALPELERCYLLDNVERRMARDWSACGGASGKAWRRSAKPGIARPSANGTPNWGPWPRRCCSKGAPHSYWLASARARP